MAKVSITGMTYAAWVAARNLLIVGSQVRNNVLYFQRFDGSEFSAGQVGGIPGPPGSITSSPAGGDLTGTYPNPTIAANAVTGTKIVSSTLTDGHFVAANKDGVATKASLRTLGTGAQQAAAGNHTHNIPRIRSGLVSHTASAVNVKTIVPYANLWASDFFTGLPDIVIVPDTTVPENVPYFSVCDRTSTGFSIAATRTTTAATNYHYIAVQQVG